MNPKRISAEEAAQLVKDRDTLCIGGGGAGHAVPDKLMEALGKRYERTSQPGNITILHPCGLGENNERGLNHLAHEGLAETVIGGFWGNAPKMARLGAEGKVKGYNFPQGVLSHLMRATAGGERGLLTKTGLHTFVDPRYEGGKVNENTDRDLVEVVTIAREEFLFYHTLPVDICFIRGSSIDTNGNLTMENEVATFAMLSIAQATKINGGVVIAQVKSAHSGKAKPVHVKVPGVLIDYVVVDPDQTMTYLTDFEPAFIDREAAYETDALTLEGIKRVIARRAVLELPEKRFVNLGYGMADGIPIVAKEENLLGQIIFMIEQGQTDGVIATGLNFGAMYNPAAIADDGYQFDFFHGGGLDICFLGFGQIDRAGNVNASRFGNIFTGCGGFIDISQHTKKIVFCGAFSAKADVRVEENGVEVKYPGKFRKFVNEVEQVTFNGRQAVQSGQEVLYLTERGLFQLTESGIELIEISPGVDLERDILSMMEFKPGISKHLKTMDKKIFKHEPLNLDHERASK
ncbi:MAG: acyl CoA:acetate/3-ketoacid CoA transferase [Cytophagales bacterium]|nr:acyl CoA:acetate/3-ketoacid CoA transferase [Cytophagales bacterium]